MHIAGGKLLVLHSKMFQHNVDPDFCVVSILAVHN
jgi:hypothetical protein